MAITFSDVVEDGLNGVSSTTNTVAVPPNTVDGDLLLAVVAIDDSAGTNSVTPPSGWTTEVAYLAGATANVGIGLYSRVASSEPASYVWTIGAARRFTVVTFRCLGADTATPIDVSSQLEDNTYDAFCTIPSITPTAADKMLLGVWCTDVAMAGPAVSSPAGFTELAWAGSDVSDQITVEVAYKQLTTASPTGIQSWETSSSTRRNVGGSYALNPAAAAASNIEIDMQNRVFRTS